LLVFVHVAMTMWVDVFIRDKALDNSVSGNAIQCGLNITWMHVELLVPVTGDGMLVDLYRNIVFSNFMVEYVSAKQGVQVVMNERFLDILRTIYMASTSAFL